MPPTSITLHIAGVALTLYGEGLTDIFFGTPLGAEALDCFVESGNGLAEAVGEGAQAYSSHGALHCVPLTCCVEVRVVECWPVPMGEALSQKNSSNHTLGETRTAAGDSNSIDGTQFCYWREDVRLELSADGTTGVTWMDGSRGEIWAVVQLVLSALLLREGGGLIHGSAGVVDGHAWLNPGPSGTGKSTIAREAGFDHVLADEIVAVRPRGDGAGYIAWGTPFWSQGRTLPLNPRGAPIAVMTRPVKATQVALGPLADDEAVAWLLRCVTVYDNAPATRGAAFGLACDLVSRVDPIRLEFPKEGPWLPAALKAYRQISSSRPMT
ncbi:MAG: hypothetical protein ACE366_08450 [Bradymonadia bacterium]